MAKPYLVDTNVLLEAARTYYAFERVPGFWRWLDGAIEMGAVKTVSLVAEEIDFPEPLVDWLKDKKGGPFFVDVSELGIQSRLGDIGDWIVRAPFGPEHIAKFMAGADPWLVSAGSTLGGTVVTQEKLGGPGTKKVKIPDVCRQFGVRCVNTFVMLDELSAAF
jgi:hypothetical protein